MAKFTPNFELITLVPPGVNANSDKKILLIDFFYALVNGKSLEVNKFHLQQILKQDLNIKTRKMDRILLNVLLDAMMYYMSKWPGWERSSEYFSGQLAYSQWFERFRQYLIFKSNFIIKNADKFAKEARESLASTSSQTDPVDPENKPTAPYVLCVGAPPSVLNNIVFMESQGNVLIKQHLEKKWQPLSLKQLLNWPHVSVEVKLPEIGLKRSNIHDFQRYISLSGDHTDVPEESRIRYVKQTSEAVDGLQPYAYDFIKTYWRHLSQTLSKINGINRRRLKELTAIFTEFFADMKEANLYNCTLCPEVSVGYRIGNCKYIRNKKMVSSDCSASDKDGNAINFYEIVVPQVEFTLDYLKATQDHQDKVVSFKSLNILEKQMKTPNHPAVAKMKDLVNTCTVFHCTLCKQNFSGPDAHFNLTQHFAGSHKAEQAMLCHKCRRQFDVRILVGERWIHKCM